MQDLRPTGLPSRVIGHSVFTAFTPETLKDVKGVDMYGARALAITYPGDVLQLSPQLSCSALLTSICRHYERVGLSVTDQFVFDESLDVFRQFPDHMFDPFLFNREVGKLTGQEKRARITEWMNDKNNFINWCIASGIPVPNTKTFSNFHDFRWTGTEGIDFSVAVKAAESASGMHVIVCKNADQMFDEVRTLPRNEPFQVQECLPSNTQFCSIQYFVRPDGHYKHGPITIQKIIGTEHNGNIFPVGFSDDVVDAIGDTILQHKIKEGFFGHCGFDFAYLDGQVWFIEDNPRNTAVKYYAEPAERLGAKGWESEYVHTSHKNFLKIMTEREAWEYSKEKGYGIVIISWATIVAGKLGVLVLGTDEQRQETLETFRSIVA